MALTSVFVPRGKGNLASFISVNSDATRDEYGTIRMLGSPSPTPGTGQIANEMQTDDEVVRRSPFRNRARHRRCSATC